MIVIAHNRSKEKGQFSAGTNGPEGSSVLGEERFLNSYS